MVAEAHRILMRGGVFSTRATPARIRAATAGLRLLYEATDRLHHGAGGRPRQHRAEPMLGVSPSALHQRVGLMFGSEERGRAHRALPPRARRTKEADAPLFAERALFRRRGGDCSMAY